VLPAAFMEYGVDFFSIRAPRWARAPRGRKETGRQQGMQRTIKSLERINISFAHNEEIVGKIVMAASEAKETCARIHGALSTLPLRRSADAGVPSDGLYFFYEDGEINSHGTGARVVRVGNHPHAAGGLRNRLRNHYPGNKNASVFRKFLGGALIRQRNPDDPCLLPGPGQGHWERQDGKACSTCKPVEQEVSRLLKEHFSFRCVRIVDRTERNRFEQLLIASLARCPKCEASPMWLGRYAYSSNVRGAGLWNSDFIDSVPLTISELTRFESLAQRTVADS
jgi:hypothetical protein